MNQLSGTSSTSFTSLTSTVSTFITKLATITDSQSFAKFAQLADAIDKVSRASKNLVTATDKAGRSVRRLVGASEDTSSALNGITASFKQVFSAVAGGSIIYTVIRGFKDAIKVMTDLEYQMRAVNTIARASDEVLGKMTQQVLNLSSTWGMAKSDLTKALYDINSATIIGSDAMTVLEVSAKAARAGFTEVSKTADIISKVIKVYNYTAQDASYISDVLFTTVERGINPMDQLSQYMGRVLTGAANAGVAFEEVAASIATMTTRGLQTNLAVTALNSMILKLAGNSKKLNATFQAYGYESSAAALRTLGLQKTMKLLQKETGGATDKLTRLGFNYRDIRAATILASDALSEYNKTLAMFAESADGASATERALLQVNETMQMKWDKLKQSVSNYVIALNEFISSSNVIKGILDSITSAVKYLTDAYRASWSEMTSMQTVVVALTSAFNGLLIVGAVTSALLGVRKVIKGVVSGISVLIGKFTHLTKLIRVYCKLMRKKIAVNMASGVSLKALAASFKVATVSAATFIGTITAGVAIIGTLGYALYKASKELKEFSKRNNISLDLGVQSSMDTNTKILTTKAGLLKRAFRESIGKSTEEYNRAKENLLQFDAALQKLISSGKVSGSAFTGMSKATQKLVSEADKNPARKLIEGFEQFDNVVKQNENSITKLIDKIAQIDKTPVGKSFGAFEKYNKFADAQAGMRDVVQRMESKRAEFNALNVMSNGNKVTIDSAEAFLQGKGYANALSSLNKHVAGIQNKSADLLKSIPDDANFSVIKNLMDNLSRSSQTLKKSFNISKMDYLLNESFADIGVVRKLEAKISKEPTETAKWYARQGLAKDFETPLTRLGAAGVALNEYPLLESTALSYKRSTSALSKLGFNYNIKDGLSLKNKELQDKIGWNWDSGKDVKTNIEALSKAFSDFNGNLTKTESDLQTSITKLAAEYKKHAEEFAKQLPKILQEADKMAQGLFNAGKKSLTLPEQITKLQKNLSTSTNIPSLMSITTMTGSAEDAGRAMRDLIKNTSKADLPKLLNDISVFTDLQKAQIEYKKALTKQKDALNKSLTKMKVDKMVDPISYYRSQFDSAFSNVQSMASSGKLDVNTLNKFKEARDNYYNSLKGRTSYQAAPAMGQTQAIRAGTQEAQALLSKTVYATSYKVDKDILHSTKDIESKTKDVASILKTISKNITESGFVLVTE
jgi:TP901 family phage tail tape measure protein